ncbi:MAG: spermidine synthase [Betaproteobacteria bacterium]|nr:spermidine synthase [Betaproteobacteria bacterium]
MTTRIPVSVFFALFTISGFAGLIYQSIWSHYLKLFLGHAAYAQTLVLSIFMGGMALGSWLVSRYTNRIRQLLLGYALAELFIGFLAIAFHGAFVAVTGWAFDTVLPALGGTGSVDYFKWGLASALILPASILLGTTFPLMSAGIMRVYPQEGGRALSMLYFTNSFGAAAGVLASGFYLIERIGLPGAMLTAGLVNVSLAFMVWIITKRIDERAAPPPAATAKGSGEGGLRLLRLMTLLAFATGAASFAYEIAWIRMLSLGLGASSHAFEVMLSAFILGMSLGGLVLRLIPNAFRNDLRWLAGILAAKGIFAVGALGVYGGVLEFVAWSMRAVSPTAEGYVLLNVSGLAASMMVMFPAAFCAGMTLPLATSALLARGHGESSIGRIYGANTAGCIAGAAFATHVGMESFGVKGVTGLGAFADLAMAAAVFAIGLKFTFRTAFAAAATVAVAAVAIFASSDLDPLKMASGVFRYGRFVSPDQAKLPFYRDGKTATIAVMDIGNMRSIRTNGKPDAAVEMKNRAKPANDEATMVLAAALPLAFKPEAKRIANIGFGSGLTTHAALASPVAELVDSIEIERMMIEGARLFDPHNRRAYHDPRSRIHIEDAKTYFASHGTRYDVIVSEPSNPWVSGVSSLFSEEFYQLMGRYLTDDGVLLQWIQVYEINFELFASIAKALGNNFGDYQMFVSNPGDILIVATKAKQLPAMKDTLFGWPEMSKDLASLGYRSLADLQNARIGSRKAMEPLFRSGIYPPNSDYFPMIDTRAAKARFMREQASDMSYLSRTFIPFTALFAPDSRYDPATLDFAWTIAAEPPTQGLNAKRVWSTFLSTDGSEAPGLDPRVAVQIGLARDGLVNCSARPERWVDLIEDVYRGTIPYLNVAAHRELHARITGSRCHAKLPAIERDRIDLYDALALREPVRAAVLAERLLDSGRKWSQADGSHLLFAAVSGRILEGNVAAAKAQWAKHSKIIDSRQLDRLATRLLVTWIDPDFRVPDALPAAGDKPAKN